MGYHTFRFECFMDTLSKCPKQNILNWLHKVQSVLAKSGQFTSKFLRDNVISAYIDDEKMAKQMVKAKEGVITLKKNRYITICKNNKESEYVCRNFSRYWL